MSWPANVQRGLENFDADGDGVLSFEEVVRLDERYPIILYPAFRLQRRLRTAIMPISDWDQVAYNREFAEEWARSHDGAPPPKEMRDRGVPKKTIGAKVLRALGVDGNAGSRGSKRTIGPSEGVDLSAWGQHVEIKGGERIVTYKVRGEQQGERVHEAGLGTQEWRRQQRKRAMGKSQFDRRRNAREAKHTAAGGPPQSRSTDARGAPQLTRRVRPELSAAVRRGGSGGATGAGNGAATAVGGSAPATESSEPAALIDVDGATGAGYGPGVGERALPGSGAGHTPRPGDPVIAAMMGRDKAPVEHDGVSHKVRAERGHDVDAHTKLRSAGRDRGALAKSDQRGSESAWPIEFTALSRRDEHDSVSGAESGGRRPKSAVATRRALHAEVAAVYGSTSELAKSATTGTPLRRSVSFRSDTRGGNGSESMLGTASARRNRDMAAVATAVVQEGKQWREHLHDKAMTLEDEARAAVERQLHGPHRVRRPMSALQRRPANGGTLSLAKPSRISRGNLAHSTQHDRTGTPTRRPIGALTHMRAVNRAAVDKVAVIKQQRRARIEKHRAAVLRAVGTLDG